MEHRAVRLLAAAPVVTLDTALEPLALRHAHHVHEVTRREEVHADRLPDLVRLFRLVEPDLAQHARGSDVGFLEVARLRLGDLLLVRLEAELKGVVAVLCLRAHGHDRVRRRRHHGDGNLVPIVPEDLRHADLAPDQCFLPCHGSRVL
jgi:hypothetical protein